MSDLVFSIKIDLGQLTSRRDSVNLPLYSSEHNGEGRE